MPACAYAALQLAFYGPPALRDDELQQALAESQAAVALEPQDAFSRFALGRSLMPAAPLSRGAARNWSWRWKPTAASRRPGLRSAFCLHGVGPAGGRAAAVRKGRAPEPAGSAPVDLPSHARPRACTGWTGSGKPRISCALPVRQQYATYWPLGHRCARVLAERGRTRDAGAGAGPAAAGLKPGLRPGLRRAQDFFFMHAPEFVERYVGCAGAGWDRLNQHSRQRFVVHRLCR